MSQFCLNVDKYRENVKANLIAFINSLPGDKPWRVTIDPLTKDRTSKQNRALFGVAYQELEQQSGNDKNDMHSFFCGEFFGWTTKNIFGMTKKVPVRTTTTNEDGYHDFVSTQVFAEFYNFVQRRAAENGFSVSDPDPMWRLNREREYNQREDSGHSQ